MLPAIETADVSEAIDAVAAGKTAVIVDQQTTAALGMVVMAAEHAAAPSLHALSKLATGWSYLALTDERCEELGLELAAARDDNLLHAPLTTAIAAVEGVATGVSAAERARTIAVAIDPAKGRRDIRFGGHVLPLRARPGGVLERAGYTEAGIDLVAMGGHAPAAVLAEVVNEDGTETSGEQLAAFAARHGMPLITIGQVIAERRRTTRLVERITEATINTKRGPYRAVGYLGLLDQREHVALVRGEIDGAAEVLVYIHLACWEGDVFRSHTCGCRADLDAAQSAIERANAGVLVHLAHPHAYRHGDRSRGDRLRDFGLGAQILSDLGLSAIRVLGDHARALPGLEGYGLTLNGYRPLTDTTEQPSA